MFGDAGEGLVLTLRRVLIRSAYVASAEPEGRSLPFSGWLKLQQIASRTECVHLLYIERKNWRN